MQSLQGIWPGSSLFMNIMEFLGHIHSSNKSLHLGFNLFKDFLEDNF